jgi:hypothetical protein
MRSDEIVAQAVCADRIDTRVKQVGQTKIILEGFDATSSNR